MQQRNLDKSDLKVSVVSRSDVERLLTPDESIAAVEDAFRQQALEQPRRRGSSDCTRRTAVSISSRAADARPAVLRGQD